MKVNVLNVQGGGTIPTFGSLLLVGGGLNTLKKIVALNESDSPIPSVLMKGSGKAADLFADALAGNLLQPELMSRIDETFRDLGSDTRETVHDNLKMCANKLHNVSH